SEVHESPRQEPGETAESNHVPHLVGQLEVWPRQRLERDQAEPEHQHERAGRWHDVEQDAAPLLPTAPQLAHHGRATLEMSSSSRARVSGSHRKIKPSASSGKTT